MYLLFWVTRGFLILLVPGVMAAYSQGLQAATVQGLYRADVALADQSRDERQRGFRLALQAVLIKLTGNGDIANAAQLGGLLSKPRLHIAQYHYRLWQANKPPKLRTTATPTHVLEVSFSEESLNRALAGLGVPLWGSDRPETLLWLAIQEANNNYILTSDGSPAVRASLFQGAQQRALPVLLPLMDLQDRNAVDFSDVKAGFSERVQQASRRYGVDAILAANIRQTVSGWFSDWTLYHTTRTYRWQVTGEAIGAVIDSGMAKLAAQLAEKFSVSINSAQASTIRFRVDHIYSLDDYARVLNYLNGLKVVERVNIESVTATGVDYRLKLLGDIDDFCNAITLGTLLQTSANAQSNFAQNEPQLHYELVQ